MRPVAAAFRVMGIVNVTPDSFSDGGEWFERDAAIAHGRALAAEGAAILDVGGESTRPFADPVPEDEERARVVPVIEALRDTGAQLSIDTMKVAVARDAIEAGATYVNDVTAFRHEPAMAALVAEHGCDCCLMHMLGDPRTMQVDPRYDDVVSEVKAFLEERAAFAVGEGIAEERIMVDPGIGFGKTVEHNLELLRRLDEIAALGFTLLHRDVAQGVPREARRPRGPARARRGDGRDERPRAGARRDGLPRPRRRGDGRCAHGRGCYVARRWRLTATTTSTTSRTRTTTTRTARRRRPR